MVISPKKKSLDWMTLHGNIALRLIYILKKSIYIAIIIANHFMVARPQRRTICRAHLDVATCTHCSENIQKQAFSERLQNNINDLFEDVEVTLGSESVNTRKWSLDSFVPKCFNLERRGKAGEEKMMLNDHQRGHEEQGGELEDLLDNLCRESVFQPSEEPFLQDSLGVRQKLCQRI